MEINVTDDLKGTPDSHGTAVDQTIATLGSAAFERHRTASASATPGASPALAEALGQRSEALPNAADRSALDREIARKAIVATLRVIDTCVQRALNRVAVRIGASDDFTQAILSESALPKTEAENIGDLGIIVAEKHGVDLSKFLPELALVSSLGQYGIGVVSAVGKLHKLEKANRAAPQN